MARHSKKQMRGSHAQSSISVTSGHHVAQTHASAHQAYRSAARSHTSSEVPERPSQQFGYSADQYSRTSGSYTKAQRGNAHQGSQRNRRFWKSVLIVSLVMLLGALAALGAIVYQYVAQQNAYGDLEQYADVSESETLALADLTVDWDALQAINPDIVAWVYIPNSVINYPVVQASDNDTYLHTSFDGSTGWLASAGTIFLDANNSATFMDRNSALYGHHMNDGSMFAAIADWVDQDEFNSHRDIYLLTPAGNYRLKAFALVKTTGDDAIVQTEFASDESYQSYIQDKLDRSVVNQTGDVLSVSTITQSLILSTCEYTQDDGRAVLFAAVVETTVTDDPYVTADEEGSTGLSAQEDAVMDRQYKEAA